MSCHGIVVIMAIFVIVAINPEPMMAINSKILWYFFAFFKIDLGTYMKMEIRYMISAGSYAKESNKKHQNNEYFDVVLAGKWSFYNRHIIS